MPRRKPDAEFTKSQDNNTHFKSMMRHQKTRKKLIQLGWDKNKIYYEYNSQNFRSIEFEEPHDAIACFGCSHTFGEGVREEYRWSDIVAKSIGLKCYNLGIGATGVNSHYELVNKWVPKLKPKAVFVFASYPNRYDIYYKNTLVTLNRNIYWGNAFEHNHFQNIWKTLLDDNKNFDLNYKKTIEAIKYICLQLGIPCTVISAEEYFSIDTIDKQARDLEHPGESQHNRIAEAMLKEFYNA